MIPHQSAAGTKEAGLGNRWYRQSQAIGPGALVGLIHQPRSNRIGILRVQLARPMTKGMGLKCPKRLRAWTAA